MVTTRRERRDLGVATALVMLPSMTSLPAKKGLVAWGTRFRFNDAGPTTYRALVESGEVDEGRERSVRLVPIRADRNDPDLYPRQPKPRKTWMSRKARKLARQRARNWSARR